MSNPAPESLATNELGNAVVRLLEYGVSLWLATAFFFRGDGLIPDVAGPAILGVLDRLGCAAVVGPENLPVLRDQIVLIWRRRGQPRLEIDSLIGAGFDKVWSTDA